MAEQTFSLSKKTICNESTEKKCTTVIHCLLNYHKRLCATDKFHITRYYNALYVIKKTIIKNVYKATKLDSYIVNTARYSYLKKKTT